MPIIQTLTFICEICGNPGVAVAEVDLYSDPVIEQLDGWGTTFFSGNLACPECYAKDEANPFLYKPVDDYECREADAFVSSYDPNSDEPPF